MVAGRLAKEKSRKEAPKELSLGSAGLFYILISWWELIWRIRR
jgi:hypothetical protein